MFPYYLLFQNININGVVGGNVFRSKLIVKRFTIFQLICMIKVLVPVVLWTPFYTSRNVTKKAAHFSQLLQLLKFTWTF